MCACLSCHFGCMKLSTLIKIYNLFANSRTILSSFLYILPQLNDKLEKEITCKKTSFCHLLLKEVYKLFSLQY